MRLTRIIVAALFLALTVSAANAYTLVMRDGRRVEIPNEFTVTNSTLTYEAGTGFQITIQLSTVDIAATERANGEPSGSLLQKGSAPAPVPQTRQRRQSANRSITNKDLEGYRQARIQSEIAYEKRRKELGLPTAEQQRIESAAIVDRTHQQLLGMKAEDKDAEEYWRGRASNLRSEMASVDAQIGYVRGRLAELPENNSYGGFSTVMPYGGVFPQYGTFPFQNTWRSYPYGITTITKTGPHAFYGRVYPRANPFAFSLARGINRYNSWPYGSVLAQPYQSYDASWERAELIGKLNDLEMQRAGLRSRWRDLEEEARRAGAYPGWLR
jgi:hypothetical protein